MCVQECMHPHPLLPAEGGNPSCKCQVRCGLQWGCVPDCLCHEHTAVPYCLLGEGGRRDSILQTFTGISLPWYMDLTVWPNNKLYRGISYFA